MSVSTFAHASAEILSKKEAESYLESILGTADVRLKNLNWNVARERLGTELNNKADRY